MYLLDFTQILKKRVDLQNHQVIISHGTGNQLFQYTFAHYLALQNNCSVKIENSPIVSRLGGVRVKILGLQDYYLDALIQNLREIK